MICVYGWSYLYQMLSAGGLPVEHASIANVEFPHSDLFHHEKPSVTSTTKVHELRVHFCKLVSPCKNMQLQLQ